MIRIQRESVKVRSVWIYQESSLIYLDIGFLQPGHITFFCFFFISYFFCFSFISVEADVEYVEEAGSGLTLQP